MLPRQPLVFSLVGGGKKGMTAYSGLTLLYSVMKQIGLPSAVEDQFPAPGSGRGYSALSIISSFIVLLHAGGRTLSDNRRLSRDGYFSQTAIADDETLRRWMHRYSTVAGLSALSLFV